MVPSERLSVLSQDHFAFDEYTVIDTVYEAYNPMGYYERKRCTYAKADFNDEDGIRVSELEGRFAEMEGWNEAMQQTYLVVWV